ncbi:MAG: hypothetical protein E6H10_18485 [Bacteroidetes bacterium]|nr:MAG: hypothetical protein E6H10_18485 [Bacteroidota bacterium]
MIYLPVGKKIAVNTFVIRGDKIKTSWFNPRTGKTERTNSLKKQTIMNFVPPTTGLENDWVLILEEI